MPQEKTSPLVLLLKKVQLNIWKEASTCSLWAESSVPRLRIKMGTQGSELRVLQKLQPLAFDCILEGSKHFTEFAEILKLF